MYLPLYAGTSAALCSAPTGVVISKGPCYRSKPELDRLQTICCADLFRPKACMILQTSAFCTSYNSNCSAAESVCTKCRPLCCHVLLSKCTISCSVLNGAHRSHTKPVSQLQDAFTRLVSLQMQVLCHPELQLNLFVCQASLVLLPMLSLFSPVCLADQAVVAAKAAAVVGTAAAVVAAAAAAAATPITTTVATTVMGVDCCKLQVK